MSTIEIRAPYLIFLGAVERQLDAKTGQGLMDWRPEICVGQLRYPGCSADLGLPDMNPAEAAAAGAKSLVVGIAPFGGGIEAAWADTFVAAMQAGLDIVSGMHTPLASDVLLARIAAETGRQLIDVRRPPSDLSIGTGRPRQGLRVLTVGTDCAVGKKYTALALYRELRDRHVSAGEFREFRDRHVRAADLRDVELRDRHERRTDRELQQELQDRHVSATTTELRDRHVSATPATELRDRHVSATFRATGQTGILIAGSGIPMDAVVADFLSGAAESLSPDNEAEHWDVIEGQGSLFHPAYAAVTLGLLHGSQPDALVLCHDASRVVIDGYPDFPIPPLTRCMDQYLEAARLTNPAVRFAGISMNTAGLAASERAELLNATAATIGLPVVDPLVTGVGPLVDALLLT